MNKKIINGDIISYHKIIAYKTSISDYDSVIKNNNDIIKEWLLTEQGDFFKNNSELLKIDLRREYDKMCTQVAVIVEIEESKLVEYYLKYPKENQ